VEQKLQRTCHHYVDYTDLDNYAAARAINELGIHVLLDVNGCVAGCCRVLRGVLHKCVVQYVSGARGQ